MDFIKKMFTESDNSTFCPVRVGTGIIGVLYHVAAGVGLFTDAIHLDMTALGQYLQHMMTMIAAGGFTVGAKSVMKGDAQ